MRSRARGLMLLFLALLALSPGHVSAQAHPQWGNLKPGPHAVGFRHVQKYDYSRHVRPAVNFAGEVHKETAYPIQIGIWYPAVKLVKGEPITHEDLRLMALKKESFTPVTAADRDAALAGVRSLTRIFRATVSDDVLKETLAMRTAAYQDARPAAGRFPVILAGGYTLTAASVLCEYLASHGYVVMFAPTTDEVSTWQGSRPQLALNDRVRAFEYLTAEAQTLPFADPQKLAVLGVNYDGMAGLLYQMENMRASALVSINGWETVRPNNAQILNSSYLNRLKVRAPYLNFHWDQPGAPPADLSLMESLKYAERFHFVVDGLDHGGLTVNPLSVPFSGDKRRSGYEYLARSVQHFLDRFLKGDTKAEPFLRNTPQANGSPDVALKVQWHQAALPPAPYDTELADVLWGKRDVARAMRIFREAKAANPDVQLFGENELDVYAFRYRQEGRKADEVAVRQLVAEAYPKSFGALMNLGLALAANGQAGEAVKTYDQAWAIGAPPNAPNRGAAYFNLGCGYALAGEKAKALDALEKAVAEGFSNRRSYETDEDLKSLRAEPRFQELLAKLPKS